MMFFTVFGVGGRVVALLSQAPRRETGCPTANFSVASRDGSNGAFIRAELSQHLYRDIQ
jgi:hypothetical protein